MKNCLLVVVILFAATVTQASGEVCVSLSEEGSERIESVALAQSFLEARGLKLEVNPYLKTEKLPRMVATLKACFEMIEEKHQGQYKFYKVIFDNTSGTRFWASDQELSFGPSKIESCYIEVITEGFTKY